MCPDCWKWLWTTWEKSSCRLSNKQRVTQKTALCRNQGQDGEAGRFPTRAVCDLMGVATGALPAQGRVRIGLIGLLPGILSLSHEPAAVRRQCSVVKCATAGSDTASRCYNGVHQNQQLGMLPEKVGYPGCRRVFLPWLI